MLQILVGAVLSSCLGSSGTVPEDSVAEVQKDFMTKANSGRLRGAGDMVEFTDRLLLIASENEDERLSALSTALTYSGYFPSDEMDEVWTEAIETMIADYVDEDVFAPVVVSLGSASGKRAKPAKGYLDEIAESTTSDAIVGAVIYARAQPLIDKASNGALSDDERKKVVAMLEEAKAKFGELKDERGRLYADVANGTIFSIERLRIGGQAPEIEGPDTDGVAFKLSDYKGKVVMLDFWGHW